MIFDTGSYWRSRSRGFGPIGSTEKLQLSHHACKQWKASSSTREIPESRRRPVDRACYAAVQRCLPKDALSLRKAFDTSIDLSRESEMPLSSRSTV
jgi:hypothetical protein